MAEPADMQAIQQLRAELGIGGNRVDVNRLLDRFTGEQASGIRAAILLAYETGLDDGGASALADFHEDNPDAVKRCYEVLGQALGLS